MTTGKTIALTAAAAAKSLQSCPTLCDPLDGRPPGSPVPGILQARTLEWVAISFSNAWKWKVKVKSLSRVQLLATPWTAAYQAPPSMGFSRQEYWSFSFSISPSNEYSGLISFRMDWLDLLEIQGTLKSSPTPQFKSINSSALSFLYGPTFTSIHDYWKNHNFDYMDPSSAK